VAGATGYFGTESELYWVAAFVLLLKGLLIPSLLANGARFGSERELDPYVNTATRSSWPGCWCFSATRSCALVVTSQLPTAPAWPWRWD